MSVQPHLSLITVTVEEPGMILITDRVLVARVILQCRVGLEGVPVRTADVYTENLNSNRNNKYQRMSIFSLDLSRYTEIASDGDDFRCVDQIVNTEVSDG